jgi:hypothetical protein
MRPPLANDAAKTLQTVRTVSRTFAGAFTARDAFPRPSASFVCSGGGGNRTRVTSQPDAADLQGDRKSDPAEAPRPRLSNTKIPHRGRPAKRAGDWAMADVAMATSRSAVPTTTVSGTCTSRLSPPPDGRGGSRFDDGSRLSHPHAAAARGEEASPQIGETYSCCRLHSGGLRLRGVARPNSSFRHLVADVAGCASLPFPERLASSGVLHSPARVGGLASSLGGLARRSVSLCGRDAVHAGDVVERGRPRGAVAVVAQRAGVSGVPSLARGRRSLGARVGLRWAMPVEVTL